MKKYESHVITAYTGILLGDNVGFHKYAEKLMERPIFTHEFASADLWRELKERSELEFRNICMNLED